MIRIFLFCCVVSALSLGLAQVYALDKVVPQVMIESRIVEAKTDFTRELGVQWTFEQTQEGDQRFLEVTTVPQIQGETNVDQWTVVRSFLEGENFPIITPVLSEKVTVPFGSESEAVASALSTYGSKKIISQPRIVKYAHQEPSTGSAPSTDAVTSASPSASDKNYQTGAADDYPFVLGQPSIIKESSPKGDILTQEGMSIEVTPNVDSSKRGHIDPMMGLAGLRERFDLSEAKVPVLERLMVIRVLLKTEMKQKDRTEPVILITPLIIKDSE